MGKILLKGYQRLPHIRPQIHHFDRVASSSGLAAIAGKKFGTQLGSAILVTLAKERLKFTSKARRWTPRKRDIRQRHGSDIKK